MGMLEKAAGSRETCTGMERGEQSVNYEQAVAYIHGKYGKGVKRGLDNMYALLRRLGNPHEGLRCIHVAGTNGKGSTCAFLDAALRAQGYRVGLYTSPFLMRYNERMRINGCEIPDETLAALTTEVAAHVQAMEESGEGYPTVFEIGTAIVLTWFAREKVDAAVIEVGLGGTFDPTNVIYPEVSVIARIGLDHTRTLGSTLEEIAAVKGGILKPGRPCSRPRTKPSPPLSGGLPRRSTPPFSTARIGCRARCPFLHTARSLPRDSPECPRRNTKSACPVRTRWTMP